MQEDDLITLFGKLNIATGKLNSRVIKAWFDTDCENLLKWMCSSITEDCYVSAQQESEYSQLNVLTHEQLNKRIQILETEYPEIFQVEQNLFNIEVAKDTIEMLQEDIKNCDHQIQVNQLLNQSLLAELSKVSDEEIQSQLEEESAQENCIKLSQELDRINKQTYEQIQKYSSFLSNYEFAEIPLFANTIDTTEFEEKFTDATSSLIAVTKVDNDLLEISSIKYVTEVLPELENRIFHTRISQLALQMEVEACKSTLNYLETYDINAHLSFIDHDSVLMSVSANKDQQTWMLNVIEETSRKIAEQYVNQHTLKCLRNELDFFELKLNFLNKFKASIMNILLHFITIHGLYIQEKVDINSSSQFFRNINKYINKDLQDVNYRKEAMLKLISQFEDFCLNSTENKFKIVGNFGTVLAMKNSVSLREVPDRTALLRSSLEKLKKQHGVSFVTDKHMLQKIRINARVLYDFLICGPTCQIVTIPLSLQMLLFKVNQNLIDQNSSVKSLVQVAQKPKEIFSKDKWLRYRNQLWIHFMTDGTKMLSFLDQIKNENHLKEKNIQGYEK